MTTPKADVVSMLNGLPDDSSLEDIQYHLYVLEKVRRGIERAALDGAVEHGEARQRLGAWLAD